MKASEQGVISDTQQGKKQEKQRYSAIPRTLIFLQRPGQAGPELLMIKGAPDKRLWANKYNGIGGHVEADEDLLTAARRELAEETGIEGVDLHLRGVINILVDKEIPKGVMVFLFTGEFNQDSSEQAQDALQAGDEGTLAWLPVADLADYPLVDDLYELVPRLLAQDGSALGSSVLGPSVYGHYAPDDDGTMIYRLN